MRISVVSIATGGVHASAPLVVALASGANFIARVSSSDPINMAQIIVEAVRHPGFSLVQVLRWAATKLEWC